MLISTAHSVPSPPSQDPEQEILSIVRTNVLDDPEHWNVK